MSRYTIELRYLIEGNYDLGLKDYPIFDESYREQLNNKIIQHYYFREIGFETEALFKNRLNQKMNEIRIRAVIKRTGCRNELHTPFCRKQQSKIEVLYKYVIVHGG